jgi:hypothetical protein
VRIALRLYKVAMSFSDDAETPFQFFSTALVAVTGLWLWLLFAHAGQNFQANLLSLAVTGSRILRCG